MKLIDCPIEGLKIIKLDIHGDPRGFFVERYHEYKMREMGIDAQFVQDNHSRSAPGILRGLHYQQNPSQAKLVGVTHGRVFDVAVDLRVNSPTYGKHHALEISAENGILFWIPQGFAHGFCVLGDEAADMMYKVSGIYNASGEGGINYDDKELAINWPLKNPLISERDKNLGTFADYKNNPAVW